VAHIHSRVIDARLVTSTRFHHPTVTVVNALVGVRLVLPLYSCLSAEKVKRSKICIAPYHDNLIPEALRYHTVFTLQIHHTCLHLVSVHQAALLYRLVVAAVGLLLIYRP